MPTYIVTKHHAASRSGFTSTSAREAFAFYCRGTVQWVSHVEISKDGDGLTPDQLEQESLREARGAERSPL